MLLNPYRFGLPPSTLLTGLISYWKMDEASGNALDSVGTNHLTDTNTVGTAYGKVGTSRYFVSSNTEYFTIASSAELTLNNSDYTLSCWVMPVTRGNACLITKWGNGPNEFLLDNPSTFRFLIATSGGNSSVDSTNFGLSLPGAWQHVVAWHDLANKQLFISVNNGTPNSVSYAYTPITQNVAFVIGGDAATGVKWNGFIDEVGFWKRILTAGERTELYNNGGGRTHPFSAPDYVPLAGLLADLVAYWKLDEASGNAIDSHGTNHLTDTNTVGTAAGKIGGARNFVKASNEYFKQASSSRIHMSNAGFTFSAWVNPAAPFSGENDILSKWGNPPNEMFIMYDGTRFVFYAAAIGGGQTSVTANNFGAATVGNWHHIVCWFDPTLKVIGISINNGTPNTAAMASGVQPIVFNPLWFGTRDDTQFRWSGLIDEAGFWHRMLTPAERTQLYNSGNGLAYPFT